MKEKEIKIEITEEAYNHLLEHARKGETAADVLNRLTSKLKTEEKTVKPAKNNPPKTL